MNKNRKKREPRDPQKTAAVKWTAAKFTVATAYVYLIVAPNSTYSGGQAEDIRRAFNKKYHQLKALLS